MHTIYARCVFFFSSSTRKLYMNKKKWFVLFSFMLLLLLLQLRMCSGNAHTHATFVARLYVCTGAYSSALSIPVRIGVSLFFLVVHTENLSYSLAVYTQRAGNSDIHTLYVIVLSVF